MGDIVEVTDVLVLLPELDGAIVVPGSGGLVVLFHFKKRIYLVKIK
jgi:hypothetical protein